MKTKFNIQFRLIIITILICFISLFLYLLYSYVKYPGIVENNLQLYSYNNKGSINYSLYLKPNEIYNSNTIDEGKIYISEFVDYLNTEINYELTGDSEADIEANYSVIARVQGFTKSEEQQITIWEKDFPILRGKSINSDDGKLIISEEVRLNLSEYNNLVTRVEESTKIKSNTQIILLMDINLTGTTDNGTFEEHITPNIVIPLNSPMFEITTNNVDKPGTIEETIQVPVPINKTQVIIYSVILGILVFALIFLIFFTVPTPKKDPLEKELGRIFKKHGDRLVALNSSVDISNARNVRSIDDLVKLADEINKPVLYKYSEDYKEITKFFITSEDEIYILDLEYLKAKEEEIDNEELTSNIEE